MNISRRLFSAGLSLLALGPALSAVAETYPSRPIRVIVPSAPGGALDAYVRSVQPDLEKELGQPIVIENVGGGAGMIGTTVAAQARPDGYTVMAGAIQVLAQNAAVHRKLPYDTLRDFAPITQTVTVNYVMVVNPSVPAKTVPELIAYAKANPGKLTYGTTGSGSPQHLGAALFQVRTGIDLVHVPYKGIGAVVPDLLAGHVDMAIADQASMMPHVRSGKLRALAVGGLSRSADDPDLPTIAEAASLPGFEVVAWQGFVAPARTPAEIVQRLSAAVQKVQALPPVRERLQKMGFNLVGSSPEAFRRYIGEEIDKWTQVAKDNGIKAD